MWNIILESDEKRQGYSAVRRDVDFGVRTSWPSVADRGVYGSVVAPVYIDGLCGDGFCQCMRVKTG